MILTTLFLLGLPLLATVFTAWSPSLEKNHFATLAAGGGHLVATFYLLLARQNPFPVGAWFGIDPLGSFFLLILSHTFFAVALYSPGLLCKEWIAGISGLPSALLSGAELLSSCKHACGDDAEFWSALGSA